MSAAHRSETRDGMRIDWDVPITDGRRPRAARPTSSGRQGRPLSGDPELRPYAKGLAFQDGYPSAWERMAREHPDVTAGSSNLYRAGRWSTRRNGCRTTTPACASIRAAPAARRVDRSILAARNKDFYDCIEWAGVQPVVERQGRPQRHLLLRLNQWHVATLQPPHLAAMCIWEGRADWYRDMTHHGGILCTFWENWYDMQVRPCSTARASAASAAACMASWCAGRRR
jgi:hypothetical protein